MRLVYTTALVLVLGSAGATACGSDDAPVQMETDSAPPHDDHHDSPDDTSALPPEDPTCTATRHTLLDSMPCGQLRIADVDADGVQDMVVVSGRRGATIPEIRERPLHTYLGGALPLGDPEFQCCMVIGAPTDMLLADHNGDGRADPALIAYRESVGPVTTVFAGTRGPLGGYLGPTSALSLGTRPTKFAAGNLLGEPDAPALVVASAEELVLSRGEASGWVPLTDSRTPLAAPAVAIAAIDLDDDGVDEVVLRNEQGLIVFRSDGEGGPLTPGDPIAQPGVLGMKLLVGQVDGEGALDIVLLAFEGTRVGLVDAGTVTWVFTAGPASDNPVALARVDDDPHLDLVEALDGQVLAYFGNGDGTFDSPPRVLSEGVGPAPVGLEAGDLDGDGLDELAVCDDLGVLVVSATEFVRE